MSAFIMKEDGYYGRVKLPKQVFDQLDNYFFISSCTPTVKYMCANEDETRHLKSLGVKVVGCDWYKLELG